MPMLRSRSGASAAVDSVTFCDTADRLVVQAHDGRHALRITPQAGSTTAPADARDGVACVHHRDRVSPCSRCSCRRRGCRRVSAVTPSAGAAACVRTPAGLHDSFRACIGGSTILPRPRRRLRRPGAPMRGRSPGAMSLLRAPGPAQSLGVLSAPLRPAGPCRQSGTLELQSRELRTRLRRCQPTPGFIVRHALGVPASVDLAGGCGTDPRPSHEFARQAQGADRGENRQN